MARYYGGICINHTVLKRISSKKIFRTVVPHRRGGKFELQTRPRAHPVVWGMGNAAVLRRIVEGFEQGTHVLPFEFFLDADRLVFAGVGADEDEVVFVFAVDDFDR